MCPCTELEAGVPTALAVRLSSKSLWYAGSTQGAPKLQSPVRDVLGSIFGGADKQPGTGEASIVQEQANYDSISYCPPSATFDWTLCMIVLWDGQLAKL